LKKLLVTVFILCLALTSGAQDLSKVMDWKTEYTLRSYLLQIMHDQYDLRRDALSAAMQSTETFNAYRDECRRKYMDLLGQMPDRTTLDPQVTGLIPCDGYSVEKVIYESRPGHHVTANLYLPAGSGPFPAALMFCGHEMTSKATESYQETAILFARNGFIVLLVDPISQGERVQFTDSAGRRVLRGSTTEHTLLNAGASLTGTSVAAWELFDNVRSLDYLISRPEVDLERIGCLGNSGGGAQTMWFMAFEERIKVAAPCSFITCREREYELNGTGDGCQQIPFEGREHLEIADYMMIFAPKPVLILAGKYDFVDYEGTVKAFDELKTAYSVMGEPEKAEMFTREDGHGISGPKREAAVRWFRKWLCNDTSFVPEEEDRVLDEEDTWCTPQGQVTCYYNNEVTVQEVNLNRIHDLNAARRIFMSKNSNTAIREKLSGLLALDRSNRNPDVEITGSFTERGCLIKKIIIRNEGEVPLPCLMIIPNGGIDTDTVIICLDHRGKSFVLADTAFIASQAGKGRTLFLADLRGMGETAERPAANDPKYYNSEYNNAILSLHIGKPLPGQRVRDIITLLDWISSAGYLKDKPVKIIASGPAATAALMAAVVDRRISALEMSQTIKSFAETAERPLDKDWYSYIVPGILCFFDLPDMAAMRSDLKVQYINK
jgi:cephalosporin-C deacetylase-like acetyl esterase